jgi:hypothetical protein
MKTIVLLMLMLSLAGCGKKLGDTCSDSGKSGLAGDDGSCMTCSSGSPSVGSGAGCSAAVNGIACCAGSGGGSGGTGTVMGCTPATGCGTYWFGASTRLCYPTSGNCLSGGNSNCRQCY